MSGVNPERVIPFTAQLKVADDLVRANVQQPGHAVRCTMPSAVLKASNKDWRTAEQCYWFCHLRHDCELEVAASPCFVADALQRAEQRRREQCGFASRSGFMPSHPARRERS